MGIKLNPFTGQFDIAGSGGGVTTWKAPVATEATLPTVGNSAGDSRVTLDTDYLWIWDDTNTRWINTGIKSESFGSTPSADGYSLDYVNVGANRRELRLTLQPADAANPGGVSTTTQEFSGNKTFAHDVIISGDLTVNGTTTTINTANLDVEDKNITVNFGGNDASAEGAGLTVARTSTNGSIVYEDALASKWKAGELGSEIELANVSSAQVFTNKDLSDPTNDLTTASSDSFTRKSGNQQLVSIPDTASPENFVLEDFTQIITNKTIDADLNTITNIENADIKVGANIDAAKLGTGIVSNTEFDFLDGVTSSIQTQIDSKVTGPASATDNALARFDSTTGKLVQDSTAILTDIGELSGLIQLDVDNIRINANTISSSNVNGNITLDPNGTGIVQIDGDLSVSGTTTLDTALTGVLKATAGVISTSDVDLTTEVTGVLPIANGGTNSSTALNGDRIMVSSALAIIEAAALNDGQFLIGSTGAAPVAADLTPGDGVAITGGAGSVTIALSVPPSNGDLFEISFALTNNATNANVTGLALANGTVRSARVQYSLVIDDDTDYYEEGELRLVQRGADWTLSRSFSGDDSLVDFDVDTSGQVQYTTPAYSTFISGLMKFRVWVTQV